jgi:hypothetical protein
MVKVPRIKKVTPKGTFQYPKLNQINYGTDKFPVKDGNFEVDIIIDKSEPDFAAFEAFLKPLYEQAAIMARSKFDALPVTARKDLEKKGVTGPILRPLVKEMYDEKTEELLSTIRMKFKLPAGGIRKNGPKAGTAWFMRPAAIDAKGLPLPLFLENGQPHPKARRIHSGTLGRVGFEIDTNKDGSMGYFVASDATYGIRATMQVVRILKYGTAQGVNAAAYGFEGEEEGYDSSTDDYDVSQEHVAAEAPAAEAPADGTVNGNF